MTKDTLKFGGSLWLLIVGSISAISIIVGSIFWLSSYASKTDKNTEAIVDIKRDMKDRAARDDERFGRIEQKQNDQDKKLTEIYVDTKYIVKTLDEMKQDRKK